MATMFRLIIFAIIASIAYGQQVNLPHITWGGGWTANIVVVNRTTNTAPATIAFYDAIGNPLATPVNGNAPVSVYNFTLGAGGSTTLTLPANAGDGTGSGILSAAGLAVGASVTYTYHGPPGHPDFSATIPGIQSVDTSCRVPTPDNNPTYALAFDNTDGHAVGLAIADSDTTPKNVLIEAFDESGKLLGAMTVGLPGHGHISSLLIGNIPVVAGHRGTLVVHADLKIVGALALQVFPNGTITTILPLP